MAQTRETAKPKPRKAPKPVTGQKTQKPVTRQKTQKTTPEPRTVGLHAEHHYGGQGGPWGLFEARIEREIHDGDVFRHRDPAYIAETLPSLDRTLRWFDSEVRDFARMPDSGPFLIVGNHSGGMFMPDAFVLMAEWYHQRGFDEEVYALAYDFVFQMPRIGSYLRKVGCVPACQGNAEAAINRGAVVAVYPGGDAEAYRPWVDRHHIDMHGHKGFVRLALRKQVPIVPVVSHGSHETIVVLWRGEAIARALQLHRVRVKVMPILAGIPWGVAPIFMPMVPLPAKITLKVCEPLDWSEYGPEAADDEEIVERCYEQVLGRMQATLDELVDENPHPLLGRFLPFMRRQRGEDEDRA